MKSVRQVYISQEEKERRQIIILSCSTTIQSSINYCHIYLLFNYSSNKLLHYKYTYDEYENNPNVLNKVKLLYMGLEICATDNLMSLLGKLLAQVIMGKITPQEESMKKKCIFTVTPYQMCVQHIFNISVLQVNESILATFTLQ